MANQHISPLNWAFYSHGKTSEELRQSLLYTTLELETTRLAAQDEMRRREEQMIRLEDLLKRTIRERNEAQDKCHRLNMDKLLLLKRLLQRTTLVTGRSGIEEEARRGGDSSTGISSSDREESTVSPPVTDPIPLLQPPSETVELAPGKPLPEKGKLLQAVKKAGPLLQTLLLAGPLPQWRHPPPQLDSFEIPPVPITSSPATPYLPSQHSLTADVNCGGGTITRRKRGLMGCGGPDSSTETKFQRVVLQ